MKVTNYTTEFEALSLTSRIPLLYFTDNILRTYSVIHNWLLSCQQLILLLLSTFWQVFKNICCFQQLVSTRLTWLSQ